MEIFGLVIIVILLTLGTLFAVIILTNTSTKNIQYVKESTQAANYLSTITSTTPDCGSYQSVRELLQDCSLSPNWQNAPLCTGTATTVCQEARSLIKLTLEKTLGAWGKDYEFIATGTPTIEEVHIKSSPTACNEQQEKEGSSRPEKVRPGIDIILTLHICS